MQSGKHPSTKDLAGNSAFVYEPPSGSKGQFILIRKSQVLRKIKKAECLFSSFIVEVLSEARELIEDTFRVGERLGPRVRGQEGQTIRKLLSSLDLKGVVGRESRSFSIIPHLGQTVVRCVLTVLRKGAQGLSQQRVTF